MPFTVKSYASQSSTSRLEPHQLERRDPLEDEVVLEILYAGVCHSDVHVSHNDWGFGTKYPCVPGHEIVGRVESVGSKASKFKKGDLAAVGVMVDSCRECESCQHDNEQYCDGKIDTYNSEHAGREDYTKGGYSEKITVREKFVLPVPDKLDLQSAAPLLCAGITTYSPLKRFGVKKGTRVGVVGLGGLGHLGVKFANAMGAHVVAFTRTERKVAEAKRLGAHEVVVTSDKKQFEAARSTLDVILDTVPQYHPVQDYIDCLAPEGTLAIVGFIGAFKESDISTVPLIMRGRSLAGSVIGGLKETEEMLQFCAEKDVKPDVEVIKMGEINEAWERMVKGDVKYRFVIDVAHS